MPPTATMTLPPLTRSPDFNRTPTARPLSYNTRSTGQPTRMSTPSERTLPTSASTTVLALSVTGNMRPLSSSLSAIPSFSKKSIIWRLLKVAKALCKYFPFPGICLINSSSSLAFVTLQRPPPEMPSFRPSLSPLSSSSTLAPVSPAETAAISPDDPAPTMITS